MRILMAVDGSEHSEAAIDEIAQRQLPEKSCILIVSVVEPPFSFSGVDFDLQPYSVVEKEAQKRALKAVETAAANFRARTPGTEIEISTKVMSGSAKAAILEQAEDFDADLIVVGSHGHGMLERFLLGSVSQAVALHAKCSVEIVRCPRNPGRKRFQEQAIAPSE
jgi:nucleotide-binding universal stress UspA family protein